MIGHGYGQASEASTRPGVGVNVRSSLSGGGALRGAAVFWFLIAALGQLAFATYIAGFYGVATLKGDWAAWNTVMAGRLIEGDHPGNLATFAHILLAFVITMGGILQLTPQVRQRWPRFHHWNGRAYIGAAFILSLGGIFLTWNRLHELPSLANGVAITLNGLLIMLFAVVAVRHAMARNITVHHRWALRLFVAVSGVWFLRVMVMGWILVNQGPAGLGERLEGPVGIVLNFACWAFPLLVLEGYLFARDRGSAGARWMMAATLILLTLLMAAGIAMAGMFMWLPHIRLP